MERWTGTGVALVTPFDEHLEIDRASLKGLVEYVIAGGWIFGGIGHDGGDGDIERGGEGGSGGHRRGGERRTGADAGGCRGK